MRPKVETLGYPEATLRFARHYLVFELFGAGLLADFGYEGFGDMGFVGMGFGGLGGGV